MCGIAGVRRYGDMPITHEEVAILGMSLEHRGNHATGVALQTSEGVQVLKDHVPAWSFFNRPETKQFLDRWLPEASIAIIHTRFATQGDPMTNTNNHPMWAGNVAVVHNGGIRNDGYFFKTVLDGATPSCETDSDVFRAAFDKHGMTPEALTKLNSCSGSAAIAAISNTEPDKLILARSGSPLVYALSDDKVWWASEIQAIQKAVRPWVKKFGLHARKFSSDVAYFCVPDDTAYILDGTGLIHHQRFNTCSNYIAPRYNARGTYRERMDKWEKKPTPVKALPAVAATAETQYTHKSHACVNPKCNRCPNIPIKDRWNNYKCGTCGWMLTSLDSKETTNKEEFIYTRQEGSK